MRILAIDPGDKKIGIAVSDSAGIAARALTTLAHTARADDAMRIVALAEEQQADTILIGIALDTDDRVGPQARRSERLAEAVRQITSLPVILYDESHSTQVAQAALIAAGRSRRARREYIHAVSAAAILQSYLNAHSEE